MHDYMYMHVYNTLTTVLRHYYVYTYMCICTLNLQFEQMFNTTVLVFIHGERHGGSISYMDE